MCAITFPHLFSHTAYCLRFSGAPSGGRTSIWKPLVRNHRQAFCRTFQVQLDCWMISWIFPHIWWKPSVVLMKDISNLAYSTPVVHLFADDCTLYVDIQLKLKDIVHYPSKECDNFKTVSKLLPIPVNPSVKSCVTHSAIEIFILAVHILCELKCVTENVSDKPLLFQVLKKWIILQMSSQSWYFGISKMSKWWTRGSCM